MARPLPSQPGVTFLVLLASAMIIKLTSGNDTMAAFVDTLLDSDKYDNRVRPGALSGKPVVVYLDMYVNSISSIDEVNMEYSINIYFRQKWLDDRLSFSRYNETLTLNYNLFTRLWVPDVFVKNEKNGRFHAITVPNRLITLSPDGMVYYSQRLSLTLSCQMDLSRYPMDNQTCGLELESYGYTTKDVLLVWKGADPVQLKKGLELPEFFVIKDDVRDCTVEYITGTFPCLEARFYLQRQFEYYLIQTYVPSVLVVALSWVSFWIDIHAVPARITLGLLTVLTMTTQSSGVSQRLPRVSYVKAIDIWMTTCLAFVFGGLIEYSIVNVLARKEQIEADKMDAGLEMDKVVPGDGEGASLPAHGCVDRAVDHTQIELVNTKPSGPPGEPVSNNLTLQGAKRPSKCARMVRNRALMVDVVSRLLFPLVFIVFNIAYWIAFKDYGHVNPADAAQES